MRDRPPSTAQKYLFAVGHRRGGPDSLATDPRLSDNLPLVTLFAAVAAAGWLAAGGQPSWRRSWLRLHYRSWSCGAPSAVMLLVSPACSPTCFC
jgi:hypothetical protein